MGGCDDLEGGGGKMCGRHFCRSLVVGAFASSSANMLGWFNGERAWKVQFRQRSSTASIQMSRDGGFIRMR